jgi:hypothetical protein
MCPPKAFQWYNIELSVNRKMGKVHIMVRGYPPRAFHTNLCLFFFDRIGATALWLIPGASKTKGQRHVPTKWLSELTKQNRLYSMGASLLLLLVG